MPQAITTKYICPTNKRGSRISAKCNAGRIIIEWDDALDHEQNHVAAVQALIKKLGWKGQWAFGSAGKNSAGETFVPVLDYNTFTVKAP
jgi:deoxyribodipyrimidine photolyase